MMMKKVTNIACCWVSASVETHKPIPSAATRYTAAAPNTSVMLPTIGT